MIDTMLARLEKTSYKTSVTPFTADFDYSIGINYLALSCLDFCVCNLADKWANKIAEH